MLRRFRIVGRTLGPQSFGCNVDGWSAAQFFTITVSTPRAATDGGIAVDAADRDASVPCAVVRGHSLAR